MFLQYEMLRYSIRYLLISLLWPLFSNFARPERLFLGTLGNQVFYQQLVWSLGRVKLPKFFTAIPKKILHGPVSPMTTKILKLDIRNHLGHSLEVLGWPQLQYSLSKITSPNLILLFDYNFLVLLVDEEFMVCPTTFIMKILKFRGTSSY